MADRLFRVVPLGCLLVAAFASLWFGPAWTARMAAAPWLIATVFVGLPHGAADLAVSRRLCGGTATIRLFAIYAAVMAVVLLAFLATPRAVLLLFGALSVWHFGLSHALSQMSAQASALASAPPPSRTGLAVAAVARGASVLGMPLAAWPHETAVIVADLFALVGRHDRASAFPFTPATIRAAGICLTVVAIVAFFVEAVATRRFAGGVRRSMDTLVDLLVIGFLAATADPLFSVGLYFLCWHGWREMRPLAAVLAKPVGLADVLRGVAAVHVAALPLLIPTWAALLAGWWLLSPDHAARDLALLSLVAYLVVTPSHEALGGFLRAGGDRLGMTAGAMSGWRLGHHGQTTSRTL